MTEKEAKEIMEQANKFGYKAYKGPAGPDEEQIDQNNLALIKFLSRYDISIQLRDLSEYVPVDEGVTDVIVLPKGERVSYDRWGYHFNDPNTMDIELDQASFIRTAEYILKQYDKLTDET